MPFWPFARKVARPSPELGLAEHRLPNHAPATPPDSATTQRWLDQLYWETRQRLDGLRLGQHPSWLRGAGLDLADLREYQAGDDVRHLDWASSARLQQPHVRIFHEDRDVSAWFVLDASPSSQFGSTGRSQHDTAVGHAGILARLLLRQGNRVGAIVQSQAGHMQVLPAMGGKTQWWRLTHLLGTPLPSQPATSRPAQITDLGAMLHEAAGVIRHRSAVFVLSDFISQAGWGEALARLAHRHDVLAVRLFDPMQYHLPDVGLVPMRDPETGEHLWVNTSDRALRKRHAELVAQQDAVRNAQFALAGVDVLELSTDEDLPSAVLRQLHMHHPSAQAQAHQPHAAAHTSPAAHASATGSAHAGGTQTPPRPTGGLA